MVGSPYPERTPLIKVVGSSVPTTEKRLKERRTSPLRVRPFEEVDLVLFSVDIEHTHRFSEIIINHKCTRFYVINIGGEFAFC